MDHRNARILIIAEYTEQMNLLIEALVAIGHIVSPAGSAAEVSDMLDNGHFDVLIAEIGRPGVDSNDFLSGLKQLHPDLPVILITGPSEPGLVGAKFLDGVISRPFRMSHIEALIHKLLEEKQQYKAESGSGAVLVVDDDEGFRTMLVRSLQLSGYSAVGAADGETALEIVRGDGIGIIIADINMPGMDGITLMKKIRRQWPHIAIVLITGYYSEGEKPVADDIRPDGFLMKPFKIQSIEKLLKNIKSR